MSHRYRLCPTPTQEQTMFRHAGESRFVWNLALEQANQYRPGRKSSPGSAERFRQLAEARQETWLGEGSSAIQQQALRDFDQAFKNWWRKSHRRPTRRKRGVGDGFCVRDVSVRVINRRVAEIMVPKCGRVRFRLSRPLPEELKSARVTLDAAGRWHVSFTAKPEPIRHEPTGSSIGIDRGVINTMAMSDGEFLHAPSLRPKESERLLRLQRRLARQHKGSNRRSRTKRLIGRIRARERDRRKDFVEQTTTKLANAHDVIVIERLAVLKMSKTARGTVESPGKNVGHVAKQNRAIRSQAWGLIAQRLRDKTAQRGTSLIEIEAFHTSDRCYACGHQAPENRESQAIFRCLSCGHTEHADTHAARNILRLGTAAGQGAISPPDLDEIGAVAARGAGASGQAVNREPSEAA